MTTIKLRRDTAAQWATTNPILAEGEPAFAIDAKTLKIGDGTTHYNDLPYWVNSDDNAFTQRLDCIYDGVDLTQKFAAEIANYSNNPWAWIKARIQANNFKGIHVGDYIPFQLAAGTISDGQTSYSITAKTMQAQIAGIDTYYGYGYPNVVGHHIDFISTQTIGTNIQWNPTDNNNGTADVQFPWLASKIYACLNGINNESTNAFNNVKHGYNASSGGVLQLLPSALQNVIVSKIMYLPKRYSASGLLTSTPAADWTQMGKLFLPFEQEVYGNNIHSIDKASDGLDRNTMGSPVQYPLFANSNSYRNHLNKNRAYWWLAAVASGSSTHACLVDGTGPADAFGCTGTGFSAPVCFRIS